MQVVETNDEISKEDSYMPCKQWPTEQVVWWLAAANACHRLFLCTSLNDKHAKTCVKSNVNEMTTCKFCANKRELQNKLLSNLSKICCVATTIE